MAIGIGENFGTNRTKLKGDSSLNFGTRSGAVVATGSRLGIDPSPVVPGIGDFRAVLNRETVWDGTEQDG